MEIILIGGSFHRERHNVNEGQHSIKIPFPIEARLMSVDDFSYSPIAYEEYCSVVSIFGEYGIIPSNVFLFKPLSPVAFLKNLVLDYVK